MSLRQQLQQLLARLGLRPAEGGAGAQGFLDASRLVALLIFAGTVAAIVLISLVGVSTASLPVLTGQLASVRVVASAPFSYESKEQTRLAEEQVRERVPRVYRLENAPLLAFEAAVSALLPDLE